MNKRSRRGTHKIAQYRVVRPIRSTQEMIVVPFVGDKTNVQTTTSAPYGAANAVRFILQSFGRKLFSASASYVYPSLHIHDTATKHEVVRRYTKCEPEVHAILHARSCGKSRAHIGVGIAGPAHSIALARRLKHASSPTGYCTLRVPFESPSHRLPAAKAASILCARSVVKPSLRHVISWPRAPDRLLRDRTFRGTRSLTDFCGASTKFGWRSAEDQR